MVIETVSVVAQEHSAIQASDRGKKYEVSLTRMEETTNGLSGGFRIITLKGYPDRRGQKQADIVPREEQHEANG
jgi:hypothetical protein